VAPRRRLAAARPRREQLKVAVRRLYAAHRGKYGSPRIAADLRDEGWTVSVNTVAGVMAELGLAARRKKKRKRTTRAGRGRWRAEDLVGRNFCNDAPDELWFGDGTEIPADEGKLYLTACWTSPRAGSSDSRSGSTTTRTSQSRRSGEAGSSGNQVSAEWWKLTRRLARRGLPATE
jgi:transposase InsO family protein